MTARGGCQFCDDQPIPGVLVELERVDEDERWPAGLRLVSRCSLCARYESDDDAAVALVRAMDGYTWRRVWDTATTWRPFIVKEGTRQDRDVHLFAATDQPGKEKGEQGAPPAPHTALLHEMTCTCGKAEPVGKAEIATIADVQLRTVHTWRQRGNLPPADYESVNGSEAWEKGTIMLWMAATGRLPNRRRKEANRYARDLHGVSLDTWLEDNEVPRRRR